MEYEIKITEPSEYNLVIAKRRHIGVTGVIRCDKPLADNVLFKAELYDENNHLVRHTVTNIKNNKNIYTGSKDLTLYPEGYDDDLSKLKKYGFAELIVDDINHPSESLNNAVIKAFYNDNVFHTFFVTATDKEHGLLLDDGMNFKDENGNPYTYLKKGKYTMKVSLSLSDKILCEDFKEIRIDDFKETMICRFNPLNHKEKMLAWAKEKGFNIVKDTIPGYLNSYMGVWLYHMGLLKMYRASDVSLYHQGLTNLFNYLIDDTSTSYKTELGYLQSLKAIRDENRFACYYYDIGEADIDNKKGKICRFGNDEKMHVYRIDKVNGNTKENLYYLDGRNVTEHQYGDYKFNKEDKIAITGVIKPYQLDENDVILKDDNTYDYKTYPDYVIYSFHNKEKFSFYERRMNMERFDKISIGNSVYEFYNIIDLKELNGKGFYDVKIDVLDNHKNAICSKCIKIEIK